jgi:hypothetical protein
MNAMLSDRTYRISGIQPHFALGVLILLTAFAPLVLAQAMGGAHALFDLIWLAGLTWFWFNALIRIAYRIDVTGDAVVFKSIARRHRTSLSRIRSMRSRSGGLVTVRWDEGRVDLWGAFDGWHDFVNRVIAANPSVELQGV